MTFIKFFFLVFVFCFSSLFAQNITFSGTVMDDKSGEVIIFASVYIPGTSYTTTTNAYGFFSLTYPQLKDSVKVVVDFMGYVSKTITISGKQDVNTKIRIKKEVVEVEKVVIKKKKKQLEEIHNSTQMGLIKVSAKDIKKIPTIAGESDLIKVVQLLPGVQGGGEGQSRMFVRGGDADQNLILLDEAVVYNVSHLFGFFSVFNSEAIKDLSLLKGPFPSNYGGRLSSVLDIKMEDGNMKSFHGSGGIGILSSRLTLSAPIVKNKASFILSGRRTYIDQVFKLVKVPLPYYFYDLNAKVNAVLSPKDRLYFSSYYGNDVLKLTDNVADTSKSSDLTLNFGFNLGNYTNTLRWNRVFNDKLFCNTSLINTNFKYEINGKFNNNSLFISSKIYDYGVKTDFSYNSSTSIKFKYGGSLVDHFFKPNIISTSGEISEEIKSKPAKTLSAIEYGVYLNADYKASEKFEVSPGIRFSGSSVKEKNYLFPEPRLGVKYSVTKNDVVKGGYSRMYQYMHLVSSSTVALPTDLWYPVTATVKPQNSDQVALGYSKMFSKINTNISVEGYYKWLNNLVEYREGANLVLNDDFEKELLQGKGNAYGLEFLVKRDEGRITGWVGYTLSWSNRHFEQLNKGIAFPAKYDRRHNVNVVLNCEITKRFLFSAVWVFASGAKFTPQIGAYAFPNSSYTAVEIIPIYTDRNAVSMSPTHRLDVNFIFKGKATKKFKSEWHIGAYNVYNSITPYRIYLKVSDDQRKYMQKGLFGFIPSVAYNFEF